MKTKSKLPVIILGTGGHAKVVASVLTLSNYKILGLISPDSVKGSECFGIKVLGDDDALDFYSSKDIMLANGIGSLPGKNLRWKLAKKFRDKGYEFVNVIHPSAIIADGVQFGDGVQVMAGSIIQPGTSIGQDTIINTSSNIDHDCEISKNCHLSPSVTLSGGVKINNGTHLGTGTVVIQNIMIGSACIVAAGSVIYNDIADGVTLIQNKNNVIKKV